MAQEAGRLLADGQRLSACGWPRVVCLRKSGLLADGPWSSACGWLVVVCLRIARGRLLADSPWSSAFGWPEVVCLRMARGRLQMAQGLAVPLSRRRKMGVSVLASLLYGCEVQVHSAKQLQVMQGFINRVVRGIALKKGDGIKKMKGNVTMTGLRLQIGIDHVEVYIADRTLGWLGHTARRGLERWEYKTLRAWLELESSCPTVDKGELRWTRQVQEWLTRLEVLEGSQDSWETIATTRDRQGGLSRGNKVKKKFIEELRKEKDRDTYKRRHEYDAANAAAAAAKAQAAPLEMAVASSSDNDSVWADIEAILHEQPMTDQKTVNPPKKLSVATAGCSWQKLLCTTTRLRCPALKAQDLVPTAASNRKQKRQRLSRPTLTMKQENRRQRLDRQGEYNIKLLECPCCEKRFPRRHQEMCPSMPHANWVTGVKEKLRKEVDDAKVNR